jgi:hypothetical protein
MADFNKLKDTIRGAIYPNGRGAISADKHQAALLDMADTMQETDTKLTELCLDIGRAVKSDQVREIIIMRESEYDSSIDYGEALIGLLEG